MSKNVVITGVAGGIGREIAKYFYEKDWNVIGIDKENVEYDFIETYIKNDLSETENIKLIHEEIKDEYDGLDGLINNAALQICKSIINTTEKDLDKIFNVNFKASFLLIKYLYPLLKNNQGSIVNISSVHAFSTSKDISVYAATKASLLSLTRSCALEFAEDNVRANAILPGAVDTSMLRDGLSREHSKGKIIDDKIDNLAKKHPLKKIGYPDEIAPLVYFLVDDDKSSFVTGQSFVVDGGALAQLSTET